MTITPDLAREWLGNNLHNRTLYDKHVLFLVKQINEGKWVMNGESIKFNSKNHLIDGQHRLHAIIKSGKSIESLVLFNVPNNAMPVIDTGRNRNYSDAISISYRDVKNVHNVSASARLILMYDKGLLGTLQGRGNGTNRSDSPDNTDILEFIEKNTSFFDFINDSLSTYNKGDKLISPRIFCGLKWLTDSSNIEASDNFFNQLSNGAGISKGNPVFALRQLLIKAKTSGNILHELRGGDYVKLVIITWNKFIKNEEVFNIHWRAKDPETIIGRPPKNIKK